MPRTIVRVLNTATTVMVVLVVVVTLLLVGTKPFGIHPYAVMSGSMEPEYPTGSLIYVKEVDSNDLAAGDVITFMVDRNTTVTHRIVERVPDPDDPSTVRYQTKGDANQQADTALVHEDNVVGTPVLTIPFLGYFSNFITTPPGSYVGVSFCAIIVFLMFFPELFSGGGKKKEEGDGGSEEVFVPRGPQAALPAAAAATAPAYAASAAPVRMAPDEEAVYLALGAQRELARRRAARAQAANSAQFSQAARPQTAARPQAASQNARMQPGRPAARTSTQPTRRPSARPSAREYESMSRGGYAQARRVSNRKGL